MNIFVYKIIQVIVGEFYKHRPPICLQKTCHKFAIVAYGFALVMLLLYDY